MLILADDLGYGDLACQGARDMRTPYIDSLAKRGMRWTNFYANSPVCSPSRAALLSGRYPDMVGVPGVIRTYAQDSWGYLAPSAVLVPKLLKPAGYHSALIGKWHLGAESPNLPNDRGFDEFQGFLGDMFDSYTTHLRHGVNNMRHNEQTIEPAGHATDLYTDWAIEYCNSRKTDGKPFFLYLAHNAPHVPLQPPRTWLDKVLNREPRIDPTRAQLVASIEHLDDGVGRLLAALEKNGQLDNTLVLFTSDNGGQLNVGASCGPFRGGKGDLYEGGLRVPLCAQWPGRIPAGSVCEQVGLLMDLFPTVCEAAGVKSEQAIDGVSLGPWLAGQPAKESERAVFYMRREGGAYLGRDYHAARIGQWKLVQNRPFDPYELYNLNKDPRETTDLAAKNKKIFDRTSSALRLHLQAAGGVPWQKPRD